MTAEKDIDVMSSVGLGGNKSALGQIQQQQQQQMRANQIKWNNQFNQPPSKPIGEFNW